MNDKHVSTTKLRQGLVANTNVLFQHSFPSHLAFMLPLAAHVWRQASRNRETGPVSQALIEKGMCYMSAIRIGETGVKTRGWIQYWLLFIFLQLSQLRIYLRYVCHLLASVMGHYFWVRSNTLKWIRELKILVANEDIQFCHQYFLDPLGLGVVMFVKIFDYESNNNKRQTVCWAMRSKYQREPVSAGLSSEPSGSCELIPLNKS